MLDTRTHTSTHTSTHIYTHRQHAHASMHTHKRTHKCTHIGTHAHAHTHTHAQAHTHTHAQGVVAGQNHLRRQVWLAYHAPYSTERHSDFIAAAAAAGGVSHEVLGWTAEGRPMDMLTLGAVRAATACHRRRLSVWRSLPFAAFPFRSSCNPFTAVLCRGRSTSGLSAGSTLARPVRCTRIALCVLTALHVLFTAFHCLYLRCPTALPLPFPGVRARCPHRRHCARGSGVLVRGGLRWPAALDLGRLGQGRPAGSHRQVTTVRWPKRCNVPWPRPSGTRHLFHTWRVLQCGMQPKRCNVGVLDRVDHLFNSALATASPAHVRHG